MDWEPYRFERLTGGTWIYLSFLLTIAVYFRFTRFFSLRNWDILTLFLLAPGLLATNRIDRMMLELPASSPATSSAAAEHAVANAETIEKLRLGYAWLIGVSAYFFIRCLVDLSLARRPRLDPNLESSGLAFLGISLLTFLMYEAVIKPPDPAGRASAAVASRILNPSTEAPETPATEPKTGAPASAVLMSGLMAAMEPLAVTMRENAPIPQNELEVGVARSMAILCHVGILTALVLFGWRHFASPATGIGLATLYLLVPVTAMNVEKIDHLLPALFLTWAVFFYRYPRVSGVLVGLAALFFYPLFLLPLWIGFYRRKGAWRFLLSFSCVIGALIVAVLWAPPLRTFLEVWMTTVPWRASDLWFQPPTLGVWTEATRFYRLPIFAAFALFSFSIAFWPREKNLADLIALSTAVILGTQFWYPDRGGAYVHWYFPLLLIMIFRPNLAGARPPEPTAKPPTSATIG